MIQTGGRIRIPCGQFERSLRACVSTWDDLWCRAQEPTYQDDDERDACRAGLCRALYTRVDGAPRYGVHYYGHQKHAAFPPATIALVDTLFGYGLWREANEALGTFLEHFVTADGTMDYYGPSLSEYGQILDLVARLGKRDAQAFLRFEAPASRMVQRLKTELKRMSAGLLPGAPEADERDKVALYFHNNAWCWNGLTSIQGLMNDPELDMLLHRYRASIRDAIRLSAVRTDKGLFIPPTPGSEIRPFSSMTESRLAGYTNYRYWPELLSSGLLPREDMLGLMDYRRHAGGELYGMTLFPVQLKDCDEHLCIDNWPLFEYGKALVRVGNRPAVHRLMRAHRLHAHTRQTWTAYECVSVDRYRPRAAICDYCLPAQLVLPRLAALSAHALP